MKTSGLLVLACVWFLAVSAAAASAVGSAGKSVVAPVPETQTQLDEVTFDTSYVFTSPIEFTDKRIAAGDEAHSEFRYLRRIPIAGNWYFQMGVDYERFDFGGSTASSPLPGCLQDLNAPIGIAYILNKEIGFLAQVKPGVFFEHRIDSGAFDIPVEIGGVLPIQEKKLYLVYGIGSSILRQYPVLPDLGVVWLIDDKWTLFGYAPEPKLVYSWSDQLSLWVGGELLMESFKTDPNTFPTAPNTKSSSGSVLDYTEIRAGLGATYTLTKYCDINFAAGYSVERDFDFYRVRKCYEADPAPYVRLQVKASF